MKVERNKNFVLRLHRDRLSVIDILTLTVFHQQDCQGASVIACSEDYCFVGSSTGRLAALNLFNLEETLVCTMGSPVTALFHLDGFVYCGSEEGLVQIYAVIPESGREHGEPTSTFLSSIADVLNDPFSEGGTSFAFKFIRSMRHPAPIMQICTDGVEMLVADMRNKVTVYPSKKTYDMRGSCLRYKRYVFASERGMIYCKTKNAFAVHVTLDSPIDDYRFSNNGGVVFVRSGTVLHVVDFNEKKVVKEVSIGEGFVYDDGRNRIVKLDGDSVTVVDGILQREYEEMENVRFRGDNIVEKRIKGLEDADEEVVSKYVDCGSKREMQKKYFKTRMDESPGRDRVFGRNAVQERTSVIESSEEVDMVVVETARAFNSSAVETEDATLLCYNLEGFMISLRSGDANKVEVNYHDVARRKIETSDVNGCVLGAFRDGNVVLANRSRMFFVSHSQRWEKEIEARVLCITNEVVVAVSDAVRIFRLDGEEIFNCLIPDIHTVCCHSKTIAVFSRELVVIDLFSATERFLLPSPVSFACFDERGRLFYRIRDQLYYLYMGLSVKVCDVPTHPLAVFGGNVVSLTQARKLLPHPCVNYTRLDDVGVLSEEAESRTEDIPACKVFKENERPESLPSTQTPTKKYNPFNKRV